MHSVYATYGPFGDLLYIGCSKNVKNRMRTHRSTAAWFPLMALRAIKVREFPSKDMALRFEARAISLLRPVFNVKHQRQPTLPGQRKPFESMETVRRWRRDGYPGMYEETS